jgi:hypothetical protein
MLRREMLWLEFFLPHLRPTDLNQFQIAQLRGQGVLHRSATSGMSLGSLFEMLQASNINAAPFLPSHNVGPGAQLLSGQSSSANDRFALEELEVRARTESRINPHEFNNG